MLFGEGLSERLLGGGGVYRSGLVGMGGLLYFPPDTQRSLLRPRFHDHVLLECILCIRCDVCYWQIRTGGVTLRHASHLLCT